MLVCIQGEDIARTLRQLDDDVDKPELLVLVDPAKVAKYYSEVILPNNYALTKAVEGKYPSREKFSDELVKMNPTNTVTPPEIEFQQKFVEIHDIIKKQSFSGRCGIFSIPGTGFLYFTHYPPEDTDIKEPIQDSGRNTAIYVYGIQQFNESKMDPSNFIQTMFQELEKVLYPRFPNLEYIQIETISQFRTELRKLHLFCSELSRVYTWRGFINQSAGRCLVAGGSLKVTRTLRPRGVSVNIIYNLEQVAQVSVDNDERFISHNTKWAALAEIMALTYLIRTQVPAIPLYFHDDFIVINRHIISKLIDKTTLHLATNFPESGGTLRTIPEILKPTK